jgi:saccharopine dehydrogenase-like NADP-dependent oxidoreductase
VSDVSSFDGTDRVIRRVAVLGLGNVGTLVADLLALAGFDVLAADSRPDAAAGRESAHLDATDEIAVAALLGSVDAVVSCLPYMLNADLARAAVQAGVHYFDLTEDTETSKVIRRLAETADTVLAPHCGLAPGFICIVGGELAGSLETVDRLALRVGALPQSPNTALGYAFTWSPAGVINEYLNACEVLDEFELATVPSLGDVERIVVDGVGYEAFATSGGLGTMCDTLAGTIRRLDYKSIRYPGHCELMRFLLLEVGLQRRRLQAEELLSDAYPGVRDDLVIVYAAAEGIRDGRRAREEIVRTYRPRVVDGRERTAIAWTTAAGVVGTIELVASRRLPTRGFVHQEQIALDEFLATSAGSLLGTGSRPDPDRAPVAT